MWSFLTLLFNWLKGVVEQQLKDIRSEQLCQSKTLKTIKENQEKIMATQEQSAAAIKLMKEETSRAARASEALGARWTALEAKIKNMGLTSEQEDELLAAVSDTTENSRKLSESLEAMGQDPNNAVPILPPDPLPPVEPS